jgi:diacylglycerol kinase family enzyme
MEAVNGLIGTDVRLGIIPIGSGNDTIVSISGHNDMMVCIDDILAANTYSLDVGRMNGDHFLNVVGLGLDAEVNHLVATKRDLVKRIGPAMTYTYAALKVLLSFEPYEVVVRLDGKKTMERNISLCTIGNGTTCGGGYKLTPKAVMTDGLLDLSISGYIGKFRSIMSIGKAYGGRHLEMESNEYARFRKAVVEGSKGEDLPYHIDGEGSYATRLEFDILPEGIRTVHRVSAPHLV